MKPWEIWTWNFPENIGRHPAVIVSSAARAGRKPLVEILRCTSQKAGRSAQPGEVLLDRADGLDWETLCRCDLLWLVEKAKLTGKRGSVTRIRRRQIVDKINAALGWKLV